MWSEPCTSSGPKGLVPASSVPYQGHSAKFLGSGLAACRGAGWQENLQCSQYQGKQRCCHLWACVSCHKVPLLAGRARGGEDWCRSLGQVPFQWSWVMITDGERTFQNLVRIFSLSSCTPPPKLLTVFHQSEVLVEMVLFLPSTFGFLVSLAFSALTYLC